MTRTANRIVPQERRFSGRFITLNKEFILSAIATGGRMEKSSRACDHGIVHAAINLEGVRVQLRDST